MCERTFFSNGLGSLAGGFECTPAFKSQFRYSPACSRQVSPFQWLLGCEPPALQSLAHRSRRHSPIQTQPDQFLHCLAGPRRKTHPYRDVGGRAASGTKAELILLWRLVADQSLDLLLLPRAQRALFAGLTPSRLGWDTPNPFSLICLPLIRYRIAVHFQLRRYRNITHALLSPSNSLLSQMFLCLGRQCSSVRFHPESLTKIQLIRNIFN